MENREQRLLSPALAEAYIDSLRKEERSAATLQKYRADLQNLLTWLAGRPVDKPAIIAYKSALMERFQAATVNCKLAAVNGLLAFCGWDDCRVRSLKVQRRAFCDQARELDKAEYRRLLAAARRKGKRRLYLLIQTLCATGVRVSEHRFITVEAARRGRATVTSKGKTREVFLPAELCRLLLAYCRERGATCGPVFVTRSGAPLDRSNIWREMKALGGEAAVEGQKIFPHNLRHLFARAFYSLEKDLSRLADLLGHSSVNTTRVYIVESGAHHARQVAAMGLVL